MVKELCTLGEVTGIEQATMIIVKYESKHWQSCLNLTKESFKNILAKLTGHWRLNYQLGKLSILVGIVCKFCEETSETCMHFCKVGK